MSVTGKVDQRHIDSDSVGSDELDVAGLGGVVGNVLTKTGADTAAFQAASGSGFDASDSPPGSPAVVGTGAVLVVPRKGLFYNPFDVIDVLFPEP